MEIIIRRGIQAAHTEDAARLYALAFESKFLNILGDAATVTLLFKNGINRQRAITAVSADNELLGIAGFQMGHQALVDIRYKTFIQFYGFFRGTAKFLILAMLFYRKADTKSQLLMDGIAVKEGNRGKGIGKRLFEALEKLAKDHQLDTIKLDVIDENPAAKKLYQKIGFAPTTYQRVPSFIKNLIGVSGVTTMVKKLQVEDISQRKK